MVKKRRCFYLPGYDPVPPRRYRELYRREGADQAEISGYKIAISKPEEAQNFGWQVTLQDGQETTTTLIEVLIWNDIVKGSMSNSIAATYWHLLRTAWTYIASGALFRLMRTRKGPVLAALYPVGALLLQLFVAVLVAWVAGRVVTGLLAVSGVDWLIGVVFWITLAVASVAMLRIFKRYDGRFFAHYLMHDYSFSARFNGAYPEALEARMSEFADQIAAAIADDTLDEVLVVGHSSGAYLGVSIMADLARDGRLLQGGPTVSFLTLGQVVPMVSFLPKAQRLRADLHDLCNEEQIFWLDVSAPADGACFALCDPVAVSGVTPEGGKIWPIVISAAFQQTLSPERFRPIRWRFFRLHFQYLCAFDRPDGYDYFRITGGTKTLRERYSGRKPSPSRIETPLSGFTSMARR